jgi:hypothetical protein
MALSARHLLRFVLPAVVGGLLLLPAAARSDVTRFGSDLSAPANVIEAHGADSAFWNVRLANGNATTAPAAGQIVEVKVKGTVIPNPNPNARQPVTMIHFQVLKPMPDGTLRVMLSSGDFYTPLGGDPQQITTYRPVNLCVDRGDYVDFNDIGGSEWWWYPYLGMPFQVFSRVSGSTTNFYTADNGTNVGTQWRPRETKQGQELLMQTTLATGRDATDICPGGYAQHIFRGLTIREPQTAILRTNPRTVKIRAHCHGENYGACEGRMTLRARINGKNTVLGTAPYRIQSAYTTNVAVQLSPVMTKKVQQARVVQTTVIAESHDDPRSDSRAHPTVPVQEKTTRGNITIKPDRTLPRRRSRNRRS